MPRFRNAVVTGALAALALIGASATARAVPVVGTFQAIGGDFGASDPVPAPFLLPPPTTPPPAWAGRFTYDTDLVASVQRADADYARYFFTRGASLSVSVAGYVYSSTASPSNPIEIDVSGNTNANDSFRITPLGQLPDPGNPLPAYPTLSFINGFDALPSAALPTTSFVIHGPNFTGFEDATIYLRSVTPPGPVGYYNIWQFASGTVEITLVPEPAGPALAWLVGIGAAILLLQRAAGKPAPARTPRA